MEVGFLSLGIMGKAMSMNLLRHGFKFPVWNMTLSKCVELVEHGASIGETPATVVKKCKYMIALLSDPSSALLVSNGDHFLTCKYTPLEIPCGEEQIHGKVCL